MWSDTRKRILIFFKWFKPSRAENRTCIAHDRHPWLMFFGAILPLEADELKHKVKETKAYSNSTASFLYRGFT